MASEAVGGGSIPPGTTPLFCAGNPLEYKDFPIPSLIGTCTESHQIAPNRSENLLPRATSTATNLRKEKAATREGDGLVDGRGLPRADRLQLQFDGRPVRFTLGFDKSLEKAGNGRE